MKKLRLTQSERSMLNVEQKAARIRLRRIADDLAQELKAIDPDLPDATRAKKAEKLREKAKLETVTLLAHMKERRAMAESQAEFFNRETVFRRASLDAPLNMQHRLSLASIHELVAFAQDAAAEDNLTLAGAVQAELSRRSVEDLNTSHTIAAALSSVIIPERDQAEPMLKEVRDIALEGEIIYRDLAGESDPVATLTAGRLMEAPIFEPSA